LPGSVNGYDDDDDELGAEGEEEFVKEHRHPPSKAINKSIPIWAKARENLRSTSTADWSKKKSTSLPPVSTQDDLRPISPRQPSLQAISWSVPFSTHTLRSTKAQPERNSSIWSNKDKNGTLSPTSPTPPSLLEQSSTATPTSFEECSLYHPIHIDNDIFPTVDGHSEVGTTTAKRRTAIVEFDCQRFCSQRVFSIVLFTSD
jgi:hypothetical protein